jgi:tetratricopeptide (TPR) repeat protein
MAQLRVRLHGEEVSNIQLESGSEYIAGRAGDAQIVLNGERGISRQHLKFYEKDGVWVCQALSKFVKIQKGGEAHDVVSLTEPCVFSVPPYEFHFDTQFENRAPEAQEEDSVNKENLPAFYQPRIEAPQLHSEGQADSQNILGGNDATQAGMVITLVPYLKISYPNTADDEILKLEGSLWVAGRDPGCEIPIDSPHVSRKHFELTKTKEGFFVTDLGSSNGTSVNGQRIPPHEPTRVDSGDEVSVKNVVMSFEIRDTNFANRLSSLPAPAFDPGMAALPAVYQPTAALALTEFPNRQDYPQLYEGRSRSGEKSKRANQRKLIIRASAVVLIAVMAYFGMQDDKPKAQNDRNPTSAANTSVAFDKLTTEQRSGIKDSFALARNLYVQGKYELCLTELAKLHELIPQYENSKELQSYCEQGRELVQRQRDLERKERERALIEQQIAGYVETCKVKLKDNGSVEETRQCLAEAIELDPEHHLIVEMVHSAQMREEEKKFFTAQKKEEDANRRRGIAHFNKAKDIYKKGDLNKSIVEFERFIKVPYPHTQDLKDQAQREVASIKKELNGKITSLLEQCRSLSSKQQWKDAYSACNKTVVEDPNNTEAKGLKSQIVSTLKQQMKGIYEDSVLEESMGNVDSAKEKWKKIMSEDLETGDYAQKARSKLSKYGIGD